jgi:hypothetical protein
MQNRQDSKQDRDRLNSSVVAGDVLSTLQEARTLLRSKKSSDIAFCAQTFKRLEPELLAHGHRLLKTYIVRNVTVEPLLPALQVQAVLNGYVLRLEVGGYGSYMNDMLDPSGDLATATPDLVFVLLDMDEMAGQLANVCARGLQREVDVEIDASIDRFHRLLQGFRSGQRAKARFDWMRLAKCDISWPGRGVQRQVQPPASHSPT